MKKKVIAIIIAVVLLITGGYFGYRYYLQEDSNTSLTLADKEWIQNNKKTLQNLSVVTNIPVLNYNGQGVVLDFVSDLEKDTDLTFNKIPYTYGSELKSDYAFTIKDKVGENDILVYKDNYVLISKGTTKYDLPSDMSDMAIGILSGNLDKVASSLASGVNLTFKEYSNITDLSSALSSGGVDAIAVPRLMYLGTLLSNSEYHIVYHISEIEQNYVISLGNITELNNILKKYYKKWSNDNFETKFDAYFVSDYFTLANVSDKDEATLKGKTYTYGYVSNYPYDVNANGLNGININILGAFKEVTGTKIETKQYSSLGSLYDSLNDNSIDFYYDTTHFVDYKLDVYRTIEPLSTKMVVVSGLANNHIINSLASLKNIVVLTIKDSNINQYLKDNGITTVEYNNISDLVKNTSATSVLALDEISYNYYLHNELSNTRIDYTYDLEDGYRYIFRDITANKVFANFFNFYLSFINEKTYEYDAYETFLLTNNTGSILINTLTVIGAIIVGMFAIYIVYLLIRKQLKKLNSGDKNNKLKYIDMLTSLKNRNYLNDHIDEWDNDNIYPKALVVVDLNNVAYINDNYGHQEGDNVIKEAANILIKTQINNSDLIRTSGNEFLAYLVAHDEKEVSSYVKKLNKEMKAIDHGFGAAVGYSMVVDATKTIDDAVNEATIDMRNNKNNVNKDE